MSDVAYLITYISYSYVINKKGTIKESELDEFILDELCEYIINNSSSKKFESVDDIEHFWNKYNGFLVWEAYCVRGATWINIKPSNEQILDKILSIIRTNSYVNMEEINVIENIDDDPIEINMSNFSNNFEVVNLEPIWEKIGDYEMNIQINLEMDY